MDSATKAKVIDVASKIYIAKGREFGLKYIQTILNEHFNEDFDSNCQEDIDYWRAIKEELLTYPNT